MKTFLRALIALLIVLWLGGVMFFPVVAATAFSSLQDTHAAGTIVGKCLRVLHYEGLFAGTVIILLLLAAQQARVYARHVGLPVIFAFIMLALTAYSQFSIIPKMEGYRIAAGGAIDAVPADNPDRVHFNQLHVTSERVEEGVLVAGLLLVVSIARLDTFKRP